MDTRRETPPRLASYDPADWGDDDDAPVRWYAARDAWAAEHGEQPDIDDVAAMPDVPFHPEEI